MQQSPQEQARHLNRNGPAAANAAFTRHGTMSTLRSLCPAGGGGGAGTVLRGALQTPFYTRVAQGTGKNNADHPSGHCTPRCFFCQKGAFGGAAFRPAAPPGAGAQLVMAPSQANPPASCNPGGTLLEVAKLLGTRRRWGAW
jgi:hypothetical protein